ncbi:MAG TPA: hypothetical protein VLM89_16595 [Phycisphaerae bacterium]|nr:hypothetical protein [Phycisphaerae bacterium]
MYRILTVALVVLGMFGPGASFALAQATTADPVQPPPPPPVPPNLTPGQLVLWYTAKAAELADRCVAGNRSAAAAAVSIIEQLRAAGEDAKARLVGHWAIDSLTLRNDRCLREIRELAFRVGRLILQAGGTREQVEQVQQVAAEQSRRVVASRQAAIERIRAAIGEPQEGTPAGG